jgi:hypothetical protein
MVFLPSGLARDAPLMKYLALRPEYGDRAGHSELVLRFYFSCLRHFIGARSTSANVLLSQSLI